MTKTFYCHSKRNHAKTLVDVITAAYTINFENPKNVQVYYNAVVWKKSSPSDHWNKNNAYRWAAERLENYPLLIEFSQSVSPIENDKSGNIEDFVKHPIGYYQYRRLEKYILTLVCRFGLSPRETSETAPASIFDPNLTPRERSQQIEYEKNLPRSGYRRRRFEKVMNRLSPPPAKSPWFSFFTPILNELFENPFMNELERSGAITSTTGTVSSNEIMEQSTTTSTQFFETFSPDRSIVVSSVIEDEQVEQKVSADKRPWKDLSSEQLEFPEIPTEPVTVPSTEPVTVPPPTEPVTVPPPTEPKKSRRFWFW